MNTKLLAVGILALAFRASAQIVVIDFTSSVTIINGTPPLPVSVGDSITGHIEANLATLPPDIAGVDTLSSYSYFDRAPGYTFSFTLGSQTINYDSVNASQEGGFTPAISLLKGPSYDMLTFVLREQGNPYHMVLNLVDLPDPLELLSGVRFPQDIHPSASGSEVATFDYGTEDNSMFVHSVLSQFSMSTVPEPDSVILATGVLLLGAAGRGAVRRIRN